MQALPDYPPNPQLVQQLRFLIEADKVKAILRKSKLFDGSRFENDAEHSWSIALMAVLLREHANFPVNLEKAITMLLIHDIVEIDAGDSFLYSSERADAHARERQAAQRIFGMLSPAQRDHFLALWEEFEARESNEAKFASVFDRMEPILQNYVNEGFTWKQNHVTYEMVLAKNGHIADGSQVLWEFVRCVLDDARRKGFFAPSANPGPA